MNPPRFILFIRTPFFEKKFGAYSLFHAYAIVKHYEHTSRNLSFYITTNRPTFNFPFIYQSGSAQDTKKIIHTMLKGLSHGTN